VASDEQPLWKVDGSAIRQWRSGLRPEVSGQVSGAIAALRRLGPTLPRPFADTIKGARHHNLKELRVNKTVRILYAFDPNRSAVLLLGGDKAGKSKRWYRENIPRAERAYDQHLRKLGKGRAWRQDQLRTRGRAEGRGR
jgi:hypothetical protein